MTSQHSPPYLSTSGHDMKLKSHRNKLILRCHLTLLKIQHEYVADLASTS